METILRWSWSTRKTKFFDQNVHVIAKKHSRVLLQKKKKNIVGFNHISAINEKY